MQELRCYWNHVRCVSSGSHSKKAHYWQAMMHTIVPVYGSGKHPSYCLYFVIRRLNKYHEKAASELSLLSSLDICSGRVYIIVFWWTFTASCVAQPDHMFSNSPDWALCLQASALHSITPPSSLTVREGFHSHNSHPILSPLLLSEVSFQRTIELSTCILESLCYLRQ